MTPWEPMYDHPPAVICPYIVRPSVSSSWNVSQFDQCGTRCAFAIRTRGASPWVVKTATGFPLWIRRVSSSPRALRAATIAWNAGQFRAAFPVPP